MPVETLLSKVESIAGETPDRIAIGEEARHATYGEFWEQACAFANMLLAYGVQHGDRVAVVLPNRIEAAVASYGTWLAGGVVVPLNAQARERDLASWIQHCGAALVVYERNHADAELAVLRQPYRGISIAVEEGKPIASIPAGHFTSQRGVMASELAMILYTSGTTGMPKGVMLSHGGLFSNALAVVRYLQLGPDDSVLSVLPFYYSYGASVLHTHLVSGARVQLARNFLFPHLVVRAIAEQRITGFSGVPSTFALLLKHGQLAGHDLSHLRYVTQAGGAMGANLTLQLRNALPGSELFIMYGQTEATARLTWLPPGQLDRKAGSVGIPIQGVCLKVVRDDGTDAEPGEDGEVWARGPGVMLGYWNNPEATHATLDDGWLRTGDTGHLDADGYLFLSGRRSDMIKTGAHRVYPGDIEDVIAEIPGVLESAVVGVDDETMGQVIKAFVVCEPDVACAAAKIKAHCLARLPTYKVPKYIEFTSELPRTASGKIRRHALLASEETP